MTRSLGTSASTFAMQDPTDAPERRCPICNQPKTGRNPFLCAACVAREYPPTIDPKKEKKK